MQISWSRFHLTKRHPLTISRGTSSGSENVLVEVEQDGLTGIGEMAPSTNGPKEETADGAVEDLTRWAPLFASCSPWEMQRIDCLLDETSGSSAARAALDCALYDWVGKRLGVPVWQMLGLDLSAIAPTSVTVGINPPSVIREIVPELLAGTCAQVIKVKLGSPEGVEADRAAFAAAQESINKGAGMGSHGGVAWRVDANEGWTGSDATKIIAWLAERGVEFVEQPVPRDHVAELQAVHRESPIPIYVDESVRTAADVPRIVGRCDGVNVKLMKAGGMREALRLIHTARAHRLKLMMGCMSESSLGITAAAHLSPLVDALDLDSHLNITNDPFRGAAFIDGRVVPGHAPGLGVHPVAPARAA